MKRWQAAVLFLTWLLIGTDLVLRAPRPARALRGLVSTGLVKDFGPFARGAISGTSPYDGNYIPGFVNNAIQPIPALPAGEFVANAIYFLPFSTNQTMQFNQIEISVRALSAAGGRCRFAVYDSRSSTDLFPKNLLAQSAADLRVDQGASIATGGCDGTGPAGPGRIVDGLSV